ncbi:MAG: chemotaxis protein CheW [Terriglobus sp.]
MSETNPNTPASTEDRYADRRALFAHQPPEGYADEMAAVLARIPDEEPGFTASMLVFRLAGLTLALPSRMLAAVSRSLAPYPLPHRRSGPVLGLVAHRGSVIPCCSLARLMGVADAAASGAQARMLILEDETRQHWAIPVDAVLSISTGAVRQDADAPSGEWMHGTFDDLHGLTAQVLKAEHLIERMKRAIA